MAIPSPGYATGDSVLDLHPDASGAATPAPPPAAPGLTFAQAFGLLGIFLLQLLVVGLIVRGIASAAGVGLDVIGSTVIVQLIAWPPTLGLALRWTGMPAREALPVRRFSPRLVPALLLANVGAVVLLGQAASLIPMPDAFQKAIASASRGSPVLLLVGGVVMAPVAEELFFRGALLHGFLRRYTVTRAVWASAAFFALFHLNPWQGVTALPVGLGYAWLTLRTGSVLPAMLGHAVANATGRWLLPLLLAGLGYTEAQSEAMSSFPPAVLALAAVAAATGGWWLWRQLSAPRPA